VQDLVAITQRIELCADLLEKDPAAAGAQMRELSKLAAGALAEVQRISKDLRPFVLEDLGLTVALDVLARDLGAQLPQAHVSCEIVGKEVRLPPELELTAYRIAQEALNNVRKHAAGATRVNIALFYEDWGIQLMVEDNGRGFELVDREALARGGHLGIAGMVERAQLFGGEINVSSVPGEGTTMSLRLPWQKQN
jgi:signal transduction histidine kinase